MKIIFRAPLILQRQGIEVASLLGGGSVGAFILHIRLISHMQQSSLTSKKPFSRELKRELPVIYTQTEKRIEAHCQVHNKGCSLLPCSC